jgi:hypothetical protein
MSNVLVIFNAASSCLLSLHHELVNLIKKNNWTQTDMDFGRRNFDTRDKLYVAKYVVHNV